jgi:hypothetical protein
VLGGFGQVDRRVDQSEMGEPLRKIPKEFVRCGVDLLREEPDIVGIAERPIKEVVRGIDLSTQGQRFDEPEGTEHKGPLAVRQAIVVPIAADEVVLEQFGLNELDGRADTGIGRREEPDSWDGQRAGIEVPTVERLREGAEFGVVATRQNRLPDLLARLAPAVEWSIQAILAGKADAAIERSPTHELRVEEVLRPAAHLPDAAVQFLPSLAAWRTSSRNFVHTSGVGVLALGPAEVFPACRSSP